MNENIFIRKVDVVGRIKLPKEILIRLELPIGFPIEFFIENNNLILKKYISSLDNNEKFL